MPVGAALLVNADEQRVTARRDGNQFEDAAMSIVTRWNVEACFSTTPLYLSHIPGIGMRWSTDAEEAFEYDDRDEAEADAEANGGEVFRFERLMRRTDVESFTGHNAESRLQHHYRDAAQ